MAQLALLDLPPAPAAEPKPRRDRQPRCPHCRAGYAPPTTTERIAMQRARADRDYAAEWASVVERHPEVADRVLAIALAMDAAKPDGHLYVNAVWVKYGEEHGEALDHNLRAPAARWLMDRSTTLAGRFRTRNSPGDPERAR